MTHTRLVLSGLVCAGLLGSTLSFAHHSMTATYIRSETTTIEGVVKKFSFRNPHVLLFVDVEGENGEIVNWMGEGNAATGWRRRGWTGKEFKPGDRLRISGAATIDGSPMVWLKTMEKLDPDTGDVLTSFSPFSDANLAAELKAPSVNSNSKDIANVPLTLPSGYINLSGVTRSLEDPDQHGFVFRNDPKISYNPVGAQARAAVDITNDPQVFCEPPGLSRQAGLTAYGVNIVQRDDKIIIDYEEYSGHREIPLSDNLPAAGPKSHLGDSVARYEGDSLIIETVNLLPNWVNHVGDIMSDEARITEVMTRDDREGVGSIIKIVTSVTDPKFYTKPHIMTRHKIFTQGYEYVENACVKPLRNRKGQSNHNISPAIDDVSGNNAPSKTLEINTIEDGDKTSPKSLWLILLLAGLAIGGGIIASRSRNRKR